MKPPDMNSFIPQFNPNKDSIPPPSLENIDPNQGVYGLSFRHYQFKKCEIDSLPHAAHAKVLRMFRNMGKCTTSNDLRVKANINSDPSPIKTAANKSDYSSLQMYVEQNFQASDALLRHQDISKAGRLFFVLVQSSKIFHVILIKSLHIP